mmetsp:Transcript_29875/g.75242  ORF Transcript_29875/g.75242 Transcript_29875/m.75242 type:complete len:201 (+) Transcript_29875:525-1127(+)
MRPDREAGHTFWMRREGSSSSIRPSSWALASAAGSPSAPVTSDGNSHMPASSPPSGRRTKQYAVGAVGAAPRRRQSAMVATCSRRCATLAALAGQSLTLTLPSPLAAACARQMPCRGQAPHGTAPALRHCTAPSSISAWLQSPGRAGSSSCSASCAMWPDSGCLAQSPPRARSRQITRITLPSTTAAFLPKAMEDTAAAV